MPVNGKPGSREKKEQSPQKKEKHRCFSYMDSGNVLLSRAVSSQVPSALKGLTSVFGMGTGGTPSPSSPETVNFFFPHILTTAQLF